MTNHPITPPPELVQQWSVSSPIQHSDESWAYELFIAHQAARWGSDQELEACCEVLARELICDGKHVATDLRMIRRPKPKPPSLKEQKLAELAATERCYPADYSTIRRALEQLND
jgi:hypothetical protein